jgi:hypothetical protein
MDTANLSPEYLAAIEKRRQERALKTYREALEFIAFHDFRTDKDRLLTMTAVAEYLRTVAREALENGGGA